MKENVKLEETLLTEQSLASIKLNSASMVEIMKKERKQEQTKKNK